jgi:cysteine desulfurase/selenocysteine lyase
MIELVGREETTYNVLPWKYEAGTPNIADVIALGAAIDYLSELGMDRVRQHEIELTAYALERLGSIPGVTIYGPKTAQERGGVVAFTVEDVHPHDLGQIVDYDGVAIRAGQHCCQVLSHALGVPATARASFYVYNTPEEVDVLVAAVEGARAMFTTEVSSIVAR